MTSAILLSVSGAMTRNRFKELMSNIQVADNGSLPAGDIMDKVRPLFSERFFQHFPKLKNLAVNESLMSYYMAKNRQTKTPKCKYIGFSHLYQTSIETQV